MDVPRTLLVTNDYPPKVGGIQRTLEALVRELPPDRVAVVAPEWRGAEAFDAAAPYEVLRQPEGFLVPTPDVARRIRRSVADTGADVVLFGAALTPYVLSSHVSLEAASGVIVAAPASADAPPDSWRPSILGGGFDLVVSERDLPQTIGRLEAEGRTPASAEAVERWRIIRGLPRFGVDFGAGSLPAEAGLEALIDFTKGCFLGQESVAKVRNLGHPPGILRRLRAPEPLRRGDAVFLDDVAVGEVTSAAPGAEESSTVLIARVSWDAGWAGLTSRDGTPLTRAD